jgi:hypothetical protein
MTDNFDLTDLPDFSGDDFANDKSIQKTRAERKAYQKMIDDSLAIVSSELGLKEASHKNFKTFLMFKNLEAIITYSLRSANTYKPLHVSIANYTTSYPSGKRYDFGTDLYLFGHLTMNTSYPKTYICKETITEKITNLLMPMDVDFEHSRKFSWKFHVVSEDKKQLLDLLQFKDLDELASFPEMELELQAKTCLFRSSRKAISPEEAHHFSELAKTIMRIFY